MAWTKARFGSHLTLNRDGSERVFPTLWQPERLQILIPPNGQSHARPFVDLESHDPSEHIRLVFHADRLEIERNGRVQEVFRL